MLSRFRYLLFFIIGISLSSIGLWIISVPQGKIKGLLETSLSREALRIEVDGLKKGLFYDLYIDRLRLKGKFGELAYIEDILVKINPFYLILLRLECSFMGKAYGGTVWGNVSFSRNKRSLNLRIEDMNIKDILYLKRLGLKGRGLLDGDLTIDNNHGEVRFTIKDAHLETVVFSGIPIELFNMVNGLISIDGDAVTLNSLSLEGNEIYGRLNGTLRNNVAQLTLELMPDATILERFHLIDRYRVFPGYYVIPIQTTLREYS